MLVFAAEFPASESGTSEDLLDCCVVWITKSPHYPWNDPLEFDVPKNSTISKEKDGHVALLGRVQIPNNEELSGTRYTWVENERYEWTTEIVGRHSPLGLWVSVRLFCDALIPGLELPVPKKPYFVRSLMSELGGGPDGEFSVSDEPYYLEQDQLDLAHRIITGQSLNEIPVAYVSSSFSSRHRINCQRLARRISGLCHVVVEPNRPFSRALALRSNFSNVYGGAVGIYWPQSEGRHERLIPENYSSLDSVENEIEEIIRRRISYARFSRAATWGDLQEAISQKKIEQLRQSDSSSLDTYMKAFDSEVDALKSQRDRYASENERLRKEITRLQGRAPGLIIPGTEQEMYHGEFSDIVIKAIDELRKASLEGSRQEIVLSSLLINNTPTGTSEQMSDSIKKVLSNVTRIDSNVIGQLEELGFSVEDGGKHYKAVFGGDPRLSFTLFKTASDHRAGKNLASDMIKKLFR